LVTYFVTVDNQRSGAVGGKRRQALRHWTLQCCTEERVGLCWCHRQSHGTW